VIYEKKKVFGENVKEVIERLYPKLEKRSVEHLIKILNISKSIVTPPIIEEKTIGALAVLSRDILLQTDIPSIKVLVNQLQAGTPDLRVVLCGGYPDKKAKWQEI